MESLLQTVSSLRLTIHTLPACRQNSLRTRHFCPKVQHCRYNLNERVKVHLKVIHGPYSRYQYHTDGNRQRQGYGRTEKQTDRQTDCRQTV